MGEQQVMGMRFVCSWTGILMISCLTLILSGCDENIENNPISVVSTNEIFEIAITSGSSVFRDYNELRLVGSETYIGNQESIHVSHSGQFYNF